MRATNYSEPDFLAKIGMHHSLKNQLALIKEQESS